MLPSVSWTDCWRPTRSAFEWSRRRDLRGVSVAGMTRTAVFAVLVCAALLAGCGNEEQVAGSTTADSVAAVTSITTASSTTSSTNAGVAPSQGLSTPNAAAESLVAAWKAEDRRAASRVADQNAIDAFFRVNFESEAAAPMLQGCRKNPGFDNRETCSFTYPGGSVHFIMRQQNDFWRVERVAYQAD